MIWRRKRKKKSTRYIPSNTLPPLHGGYRPVEGGGRPRPIHYPTPPKGAGGGSK